MAVYLLHIYPPYHHARHYIGYADDYRLHDRIAAHKAGKGSHLTRAVVAAGHRLTVVKVWMGGTRDFERLLKNRKNAPRTLCPVCRGDCPPDFEVEALVPGYMSWDAWDDLWTQHFEGVGVDPTPKQETLQ